MINPLYEDVERLFPNWKSVSERALLYAMIDVGHVTDLSCTWEHCVLPGVPLAPRGGGVKKDSMTFDHTVARVDGGTDHWSNLRLMHYTCNMRKAHAMSPEVRAKIADSSRKKWKDPEYRDRMVTAMKAKWADPEYKARVSELIRIGRQSNK